MSKERARQTELIDNERVKVSEWKFGPGAVLGHHRHEFDYVVVPMTDGQLLVKDSAGDSNWEMETGIPSFGNIGEEHEVINRQDREAVFIEIELK